MRRPTFRTSMIFFCICFARTGPTVLSPASVSYPFLFLPPSFRVNLSLTQFPDQEGRNCCSSLCLNKLVNRELSLVLNFPPHRWFSHACFVWYDDDALNFFQKRLFFMYVRRFSTRPLAPMIRSTYQFSSDSSDSTAFVPTFSLVSFKSEIFSRISSSLTASGYSKSLESGAKFKHLLFTLFNFNAYLSLQLVHVDCFACFESFSFVCGLVRIHIWN